VWTISGALALLGCGSITPLAATPSDGDVPTTVRADAGAGPPTPPDTATKPEAGPGPTPAKSGDKGDDGMGGDGEGPGGSKKDQTDASRPQK
jgi:hypothetical protein